MSQNEGLGATRVSFTSECKCLGGVGGISTTLSLTQHSLPKWNPEGAFVSFSELNSTQPLFVDYILRPVEEHIIGDSRFSIEPFFIL